MKKFETSTRHVHRLLALNSIQLSSSKYKLAVSGSIDISVQAPKSLLLPTINGILLSLLLLLLFMWLIHQSNYDDLATATYLIWLLGLNNSRHHNNRFQPSRCEPLSRSLINFNALLVLLLTFRLFPIRFLRHAFVTYIIGVVIIIAAVTLFSRARKSREWYEW